MWNRIVPVFLWNRTCHHTAPSRHLGQDMLVGMLGCWWNVLSQHIRWYSVSVSHGTSLRDLNPYFLYCFACLDSAYIRRHVFWSYFPSYVLLVHDEFSYRGRWKNSKSFLTNLLVVSLIAFFLVLFRSFLYHCIPKFPFLLMLTENSSFRTLS